MVTTLKYGAQKGSITKLLNRLNKKTSRGIDAHKFSGALNLKKDPLEFQKEIRNEWE